MLTAMAVAYCTCEQQSKDTFHNGFLYIGLFVHIGLGLLFLLLLVLERDYPLLIFPALLGGLFFYYRLEYKRQALFLGHSEPCAKRYANLAALAAAKGYDPEYGKLNSYKSSIWALTQRLFGKRKAKKVRYRAAALGISILLGGIIWMAYSDLTRVRNGLQIDGYRYEPVITESVFLAMLLAAAALLVFMHLEKRARNKKVLAAVVTIGSIAIWASMIYVLAWYARLNYWSKLLETIGVITIPIGFVVLIAKLSDKWAERRRKKRRRRSEKTH